MSKNLLQLSSNDPTLAQGRLTLTSGFPVLSSNVTGATNIYYTPYKGNKISVYNGSNWEVKTFSELTLSLSGLTANTIYDVFIYDNNGTLTLEAVAWSDSGAGTSARATTLTYLDGVRVKASDNRKYLGSFICNSTGGQINFISGVEGTPASNGFFNEYNKEDLRLEILDETSHIYTTAGWRIWRGNTNNLIKIVSSSSDINIYYRGYWGVAGGVYPVLNGEIVNALQNLISAPSAILSSGGDILVSAGLNEISLFQNGTPTNSFYDAMRLVASIQY